MSPKWERVNTDEYDFTERLEVPGGWLYRNTGALDGWRFVTLCFVPDPGPMFDLTEKGREEADAMKANDGTRRNRRGSR